MQEERHGNRRWGVSTQTSRGMVVTIVSGKGGVGKTNLALNVSIQLARRQRRVVLLDADFGLANADILLDISPRSDLADLLDPRRPLDDSLVEGPSGLKVVCGVLGSATTGRGDLGPRDCRRALDRLRRISEVVVVDCGTGISRTLVSFALLCDLLVLATTPEPTALADCYATLKLLSSQGFAGRTGVVVNMAGSRREAGEVARRLGRVAYQFLGLSVENLGHVVVDRHVPLAVRARVPVTVRYPRCPASTCMDEVSAQLLPTDWTEQGGGGLWSRLAGLFL